MKIKYQHIVSVQSSTWFQLMTVSADVEPFEEGLALEQGFLYSHGRWYQCRSTRIVLDQFKPVQKWPAKYTWKIVPEGAEFQADIERVYRAYMEYRNHQEYLPFKQPETPDKKTMYILVYNEHGVIVAFTQMFVYNGGIESGLFCWDYSEKKLRLGFAIQEVEVSYAKACGHQYLYLGVGCESSCIYKSKFPGFQWWTGEEWSNDINAYQALCTRDTDVADSIDLRQLADLTEGEMVC